MFEEFNLLYTLIMVALVAGAYWYLFSSSPPPPRIIVKQIDPIKAPARAAKKQEVIPADTKGKIKILFGTQTGTAEDFSYILSKEAKRHHIYAQVIDMELFDVNELQNEPYVIIVTATHGEGEPPDNAKTFYKWLGNAELSPTLLERVNYTVFGLGNKTYEHYNAVARYMDKRVSEIGGKKFYERGEGDDDCSLEEDFNKWKKNLWPTLCKHMGISAETMVEDEKFVPRFKLVHCPPSSSSKHSLRGGLKRANTDGSPIYDIKNPYMATILLNRELHTGHSDRSCRHIELEIGDNLHYQAGDHLGIYPENSKELVEHFAARLQSDLEAVIALVPIDSSLPANLSTEAEFQTATRDAVLGPCTLRQILTDAIDITTPPRKAVLKALVEYATNPDEKARLLNLSKDGDTADEYSKFIKHDQRTIFEVLHHFPSVNPPLAHILEMLPRLTPRYYSISSSPNAHPGRVHITSVVVRFHTPTGREHHGVCSTWLSRLQPGTKVPTFVRSSHFKLPPTPAPIIMVGPGTGLAPFRGFLQEIKHRKSHRGQHDWESVLFFGCRHRKHDYIYEEELTGFTGDNTLSHLHVAFSREQDKKVYVQDKLGDPEVKEKLWHFLNDKQGYFYVCGDARQMAKAVHQTLINVVKECGKMDESQANAFVDNLQKSGRYLQDVWF